MREEGDDKLDFIQWNFFLDIILFFKAKFSFYPASKICLSPIVNAVSSVISYLDIHYAFYNLFLIFLHAACVTKCIVTNFNYILQMQ